jgi:multidrug efflux system outer membrane protein
LEIAKRTLMAWEESVRIGQARLRQGLINKLDVDHFEAERENAAARIAELKRHMIQKENELSATLQGACRWLVSHPRLWSRAHISKTEIV